MTTATAAMRCGNADAALSTKECPCEKVSVAWYDDVKAALVTTCGYYDALLYLQATRGGTPSPHLPLGDIATARIFQIWYGIDTDKPVGLHSVPQGSGKERL